MLTGGRCLVIDDDDIPLRLLRQQAEAFREIAPWLSRLQKLGHRLRWPLGVSLMKNAVEHLEKNS
jgi:hypothetical protein